jgi:Pyruvate/2-oxoacid:ferredoxin oxidoreductase delta subunit
MSRNRERDETDKQTRIAIVNSDKCKPKRCRQECKKSCPVVRMGKLCIEVAPDSKIASLSEELCIGCGICVKVSVIPQLFKIIKKIIDIINPHRNAHSKQLPSSMFQVILTSIPLIGTRKTLSSCIVCRLPVPVKCSDWSVKTE